MATAESQQESGDGEVTSREIREFHESGAKHAIVANKDGRDAVEEIRTFINSAAPDLVQGEKFNQADVLRLLLRITGTAELNGNLSPSERKLAELAQESLASEQDRVGRWLDDMGVKHAYRKAAKLREAGYGTVEDIENADPDILVGITGIGPATIAKVTGNLSSRDRAGPVRGDATDGRAGAASIDSCPACGRDLEPGEVHDHLFNCPEI